MNTAGDRMLAGVGGRSRLAVGTAALHAVLLLVMAHAASASAAGCPSGWKAEEREEGKSTICTRGFPSPGSYLLEIPEGVTELKAAVLGGNGGSWGKTLGKGAECEQTGGGAGGIVDGTLKVKKGELLSIVVGGEGEEPNEIAGAAGGTPGGGGAGGGPCASGGGGGSFVFGEKGLLLAGGGGGGGGFQGGSGEGSKSAEFWTEGLPTMSGEFSATGDDFYCSGRNTEECQRDHIPPQQGDPCSTEYNVLTEHEATGLQFYGTGATRSAAGQGGQSSYAGQDGEDGEGPVTSASAPGVGGVGGASAYHGPPEEEEESPAGGGGGGGYYGGGGGSNGCGGGAGSDYWSPEVISPHYPESPARDVYETGHVSFSFVPAGTGISGTILSVAGEPVVGAAVDVYNLQTEPARVEETGTNSEGYYSISATPGKYAVEPVTRKGSENEFKVANCEGEAATTFEGAAYCKVTVEAGKQVHADFNAGFTVSGDVWSSEHKGVPGVKVFLQEQVGDKLETSSVTTDEAGQFSSERLNPGTVFAAAAITNSIEFFGVPSTECTASKATLQSTIGPLGSDSCEVNLTEDRQIEFAQCVLPDPGGAPLPANTPNPIPGAYTAGQLEAVGCFEHHDDGTETSTQNVRLDGVDVVPLEGAQIVIDGTSVTSTGRVLVKVRGFTLFAPATFHFNYGGGSVETNDISSNSPTLNLVPNFFGLPISLGSGGALSSPMLQATTGKTTFTLAGQTVLPGNTTAKWDVEESDFRLDGKPVPSVGLSGSVVTSNREGLQTGSICVKGASLAPFGPKGGEISQTVLCFAPQKSEWSLQALYNLPGVAQDLVRQVNVMGSIAPAGSEGQLGYRLQSVELQARGLGATIPGTNGILLGDGVFWNGAGGGWTNELGTEPPHLKDFNLSGALTLGPEVEGVAALSFDGQVKVQPEATNAKGEQIQQLYQAEGLLTAFHGSRFQLPLGHGKVRFTLSPFTSVEMEAEVGMTLGPLASFKGNASGFWDGKNQILQLDGLGSASAGPLQLNAEGLINGKAAVICLTGGNRAKVGGGFAAGALFSLITHEAEWFKEGTCDIGKYKVPNPGLASISAAGGGHAVSLRRGLSGAILAIKGAGGAPSISLSGPGGLRLATRASSPWTAGSHATILRDQAAHTTYVVLYRPAAGRYRILPLKGSAAIDSIREAEPAPRARVKATVSAGVCSRTVSYTASVPHGERVALYAKGGHELNFLGYAHSGSGHPSFAPAGLEQGKGTIVAVETERGEPRSVRTLTTYKLIAPPARAGRLHLKGHRLSWAAVCGATGYTVEVRHGRHKTKLSTHGASVTLPALHGPVTILVRALGSAGAGAAQHLRARL